MKIYIPQSGFVALMSVIIISALLLVTVYLLSASSFLERFDALDTEDKRVSLGLAEACVNAAVLQIAQSTFTSSEVKVIVDSSDSAKTCAVCQATAAGSILTRAVYHHAYTNLAVSVNPSTYQVTSWAETTTYSGIPNCPVPAP